MKKLLFAIFVACHVVAYSQSNSEFSARAKQGLLSYEECMSVPSDSFNMIIPSLMRLRNVYSNAERYNGEAYYNIMMGLYRYYVGQGDVVSSIQILREAGDVFNLREHEPNNEYIRNLLVCRGRTEIWLKNYGSALAYLNTAHRCFEEKNDNGESYMVMLLNMSLAYQANGDLLSSKIYMDEAVEQFEKFHGSIYEIKDEGLWLILANYGYLCEAIGHEKEAEKCFLTVINKSKNNFLSHEAYTLAANNLAALYMKQGRWSDGAKLLERIKSGSNENNYLFAQNLSLCYLYLNNVPKAIESLCEMNDMSQKNLASLFSNISQLERENYWTQNSRERMFLNNLVAFHSHSDQAIEIAYDNALYSKNLLVKFCRMIDKLVAESTDDNVKQKYLHYQSLREQLAYKSNKNSRVSLVKEIVNTEQSILADVTRFGDWKSKDDVSWKKVRESLADDEIAIEYSYVPIMQKYPDMKPHYGAFVLRRDFNCPKLVSLENVDSAEAIFYNDNQDKLAISKLYSGQSRTLYNMLWQKLTPYLKGIKTVYYSTAGPLAEMNFDVLQDKDGKMLNDKYNMIRVSSTDNIANVKQTHRLPLRTSVLYGNIMYDERPEDMASVSESYEEFTGTPISTELSLRSENDRGIWGAIPSTKNEIDNIGNILFKKGLMVKTYEGNRASEESFKAMSGKSPDIIHMATHGFFIETQQQADNNKFFGSTIVYSPKEAYMMWSGLMLAGGNNIWQGNFNLTNVEDGVLTADEISRLDLSKTKLVVLSACETGKGKIDPIDGVFGLQRALKMAGAGTIVMSLWKVQDDATSLLMTKFYTYLTDGIERHQSLWKAMMDVKAKYPDPYYWAGFVMLD